MISAGTILKLRRQEKNLSISEVSAELKISVDTIKKIENDEKIDKTYLVYHIGHLRAYSKFLYLEPSEIILKFKNQTFQMNEKAIKEIARPKIYPKYRFQNYIPLGILIFVLSSSYFLFINDNIKKTEYALIPDLPEIYIPVIEKASLDDTKKNSEDLKTSKFFKENFDNSSAIASNSNDLIQTSDTVTLRLLNPTWLQLRDKSDNIIISKLMNEGEEFTYDLDLSYSVTAGNAGNILVIVNKEVRGKIGNFGEVVDSIILDYSFNN